MMERRPPTPEAVLCGWTEYPFWRCARGHAYDLRLDPERDLSTPPVSNFCPGCGERLGR